MICVGADDVVSILMVEGNEGEVECFDASLGSGEGSLFLVGWLPPKESILLPTMNTRLKRGYRHHVTIMAAIMAAVLLILRICFLLYVHAAFPPILKAADANTTSC